MRAVVVERYGPPEVARVVEVAAPRVGRGEVRVRVRAVAVTSGDARIRAARFPAGFGLLGRAVLGVRGPRRQILGSAFSGEVDRIGPGGEEFAVGDAVCGMLGAKLGGHAEHVVLKPAQLARKPVAISHRDAAGVLFGGATALHFLRTKARIRAGDSVLINGASGAVGTNAVQIARLAGASVTAVCGAANADLVSRLGAGQVIDHREVAVADLEERFDVVFDTVGNLSLTQGRRLLTPTGRLLLAVASLADSVRAGGNAVAGPASERPEHFAALLAHLERGELEVVHDGAWDLDDIVAAYALVDSGRKVGNVVLGL